MFSKGSVQLGLECTSLAKRVLLQIIYLHLKEFYLWCEVKFYWDLRDYFLSVSSALSRFSHSLRNSFPPLFKQVVVSYIVFDKLWCVVAGQVL